LVDDALRQVLWAKLQAALDGEPDPWFDFQEAKVDTRQFTPIVTA
jgi:nitrite reductase (NADH) large subunit